MKLKIILNVSVLSFISNCFMINDTFINVYFNSFIANFIIGHILHLFIIKKFIEKMMNGEYLEKLNS